jgi:hypothetical protein
MVRTLPVLFVIVLAGWFAAPPLLAQSDQCRPEETAALLPPADPAYDDAIELMRAISEHGFTIKCVLTSKMGSFFGGLEGAALFRTTDGDFDALFLRSPKTFADLKINERHLKAGFGYTFAGKPSRTNRMESVRRQYFLKNTNRLLVLSDDPLRIKLMRALNIPEDGNPQ